MRRKNEQMDESFNALTGLTAAQEQAAKLMAQGKTLEATANEVGAIVSELHYWQTLPTFQCFYNQLCQDSRNILLNGLNGLAGEALSAIRGSLQSKDEGIRLKAATWLVEKIEAAKIGSTDIKQLLKERHTRKVDDLIDFSSFDNRGYKEELKKLGIKA